MTLFLLLLLADLTKADVPRLTAAELHEHLKRGEAVAIDVRGTVPFEREHIAGAVWMPLGLMQQRGGELPEDKLLVTYCTCRAEETSLDGALLLARLGFTRVAVLHGGYPAWTAAGLPTASRRADGQRVPAAISCQGELTSRAGPVTHYSRVNGKTVLTVGEQKVTLAHPGNDDPSRFFLIDGVPFASNDWNRVEVRKGEVRPDATAMVWTCSGGDTFVDWSPPPLPAP